MEKEKENEKEQEKEEKQSDDIPFHVYLRHTDSLIVRISVKNVRVTILELKQALEDRDGTLADMQRTIWGGKQLEDDKTLESYDQQGINWNERIIHVVLRLKGGNPVIYLFPSTPLPLVNVNLTLVPD